MCHCTTHSPGYSLDCLGHKIAINLRHLYLSQFFPQTFQIVVTAQLVLNLMAVFATVLNFSNSRAVPVRYNSGEFQSFAMGFLKTFYSDGRFHSSRSAEKITKAPMLCSFFVFTQFLVPRAHSASLVPTSNEANLLTSYSNNNGTARGRAVSVAVTSLSPRPVNFSARLDGSVFGNRYAVLLHFFPDNRLLFFDCRVERLLQSFIDNLVHFQLILGDSVPVQKRHVQK
uniref:(northern house mosquito) hypothetical protein n=1 Tax=Culex pipiens TaxID=7175 RepID=A0A8D8CQ85_CULPI